MQLYYCLLYSFNKSIMRLYYWMKYSVNKKYHANIVLSNKISYDHFKLFFYCLLSWQLFNKNVMGDMHVVMTLLVPTEVLCNVWSYDFYDMTLHID